MTPELQTEIERLQAFYETHNVPFTPAAPASLEALHQLEAQTGVKLDRNLRDLWLYSNGSGRAAWFASPVAADVSKVENDEEIFHLTFMSLEELYELRRIHNQSQFQDDIPDYDEEDYPEEWAAWDKRIQTGFLEHSRWLPFAQWGGWTVKLCFDAAPTSQGRVGQIIAYLHDPDMMYYIADDFISFFRQSNDWMAKEGKYIFG